MADNKNQKIISDVQNIIYKTALNIFDRITPKEQLSKVSQDDVAYTLNNLMSVINTKDAYSYLIEDDGYYVRRLTSVIGDGMKNVLKDNQVTLEDVPAILKMIDDITVAVNNIHDKKAAVTQISRHSFVPIIQTIILLICQMMLTPTQYDAARGIVVFGFKLVLVNLDPIYDFTKKDWWCFFQNCQPKSNVKTN